MKLGVLGFVPSKLADLTSDHLKQLRALGFTGTGFPTGDSPSDITSERAREVGQTYRDAGVDFVEYARYMTTLVSPDPATRAQNLAGLREACRVARAAGVDAVISGAGSMSPLGPWMPHPDNYSLATVDRLIATLREAVKPAEDAGLFLGLECHTVTPVRDARTTRDILDAVGSSALKVHLDPVNWLTWETVYRTAEATAEMFATLGPNRLVGAHSKGVAVEPKLIIHMSETYTSADDDIFDHAGLLRQAAKLPRDFYVVIEHLTPGQMPAARAHLLKVAGEIGVTFDT